jgi:hypothetical protein
MASTMIAHVVGCAQGQMSQWTVEIIDGSAVPHLAVVVQFGLRFAPVKQEIPSASLRAGSSLRLKNGSAQDDTVV